MIDIKTLKCIKCNSESLLVDEKNSKGSCSNCKQTFLIEENIPLMLVPDEESELKESDIHRAQGSKFDYKEHYKQDAIDFDYFQDRDKGTMHSEKRVHEFILSHVPKNAGRILDVGCGKAWVAENCCSIAKEVVSLDIAFTNVDKALKKYSFPNHSGIVADSLNLPFKENSFDIIIASEIIEHIVMPAKFVENMINILKPGGILLITSPYKEKLQFNLCIHCNKLTPKHAHIHSFDENSFAAMQKDSGNIQFSYKTFGSKVLMHLRTHIFLKILPFKIWLTIDKIANFIYKAPATIFVKWEKTSYSQKLSPIHKKVEHR